MGEAANTNVVELNPSVKPYQRDRRPEDYSTIHGLSPAMRQALSHAEHRLQDFDIEVLSEIQEAVLDTVNRIADERGFSLDSLSYGSDNNIADFQIEVSTWDALGHDRHARCLLQRAHEAGLTPDLLGKYFELATDNNRPYAVTGLVEVSENEFVVRLYDYRERKPSHVKPEILKHVVHKYDERRSPPKDNTAPPEFS